jgi:hypothetical protein
MPFGRRLPGNTLRSVRFRKQSASGYRACGQADAAIRILEERSGQQTNTFNAITATAGETRQHRVATRQPEPDRAIALGLHSAATAKLTGSARITRSSAPSTAC